MTRSGVQGVILEKPPKKIPTYQLYSKQFSFCSNEYRLHAKLMQSSEVTCDTLHLDECTLQALLQASCLCLLFLLKESVQERSRKDEPDETSWLSNLLIFFLNIFQVDIVVEISRVSCSILLASNNIIGLSSWRCLLRKAAWKALAATF